MNWKIEFDEKAKNELLKIDHQYRKRILKFIDERLLMSDNPKKIGEPLKGNLSGFWRYRVGSYRLICNFDEIELTVLVIHIGHRSSVYKIKI